MKALRAIYFYSNFVWLRDIIIWAQDPLHFYTPPGLQNNIGLSSNQIQYFSRRPAPMSSTPTIAPIHTYFISAIPLAKPRIRTKCDDTLPPTSDCVCYGAPLGLIYLNTGRLATNMIPPKMTFSISAIVPSFFILMKFIVQNLVFSSRRHVSHLQISGF